MKTACLSLTAMLTGVLLGCEAPNVRTLKAMAKARKDKTVTYTMNEDGTIFLAPEKEPELTQEQRQKKFRQHFQVGAQHASRKNYGLALSSFEEALKYDPTSTDARFNIAACNEATGDFVLAMKVYLQLLMMNPNDPDCYANLGTCYIKMYYRENNEEWREKARRAWSEARRLNPNQPNIERYLRQAYSDKIASRAED